MPISWLPQSGFLRFGAMLPVFLLGSHALDERPQSRRLETAFAVTAAVALLWTIEVGAYVALGLAGVGGPRAAARAGRSHGVPGGWPSSRSRSASCSRWSSLLASSCSTGIAPPWADLLHFQRAYSAGLAMVALKTVERWPIPIIIYVVTALVALTAPRVRHGSAWIFLALFGLGAMAYPLGRKTGHLADLSRVVLLSRCCSPFPSWASSSRNADRLKVEVQGRVFRIATAASAGLLAASAGLTCLVYADAAAQLDTYLALGAKRPPKAHRGGRRPAGRRSCRTPENRAAFERDVAAIAALVPPDEGLPILSKNDTLYYVFAKRTSIYKNPFYPHFFYKADIDQMVAALLTSKVGYMFLDNSGFQAYENGIDHAIAGGVWGRIAAALPIRATRRPAQRLSAAPRRPVTDLGFVQDADVATRKARGQ